jgi:hypothetical protein
VAGAEVSVLREATKAGGQQQRCRCHQGIYKGRGKPPKPQGLPGLNASHRTLQETANASVPLGKQLRTKEHYEGLKDYHALMPRLAPYSAQVRQSPGSCPRAPRESASHATQLTAVPF